MSKIILAMFLLTAVTCAANAQMAHSTLNENNPFEALDFGNSYKDTVTLRATYLGQTGDAGNGNLILLKQIGKLHGLNVNRFRNALAVSIAGTAQRFYVPYRDSNNNIVVSAKPNALLLLKCVVYRFFTIDGTTNFFYADKVIAD